MSRRERLVDCSESELSDSSSEFEEVQETESDEEGDDSNEDSEEEEEEEANELTRHEVTISIPRTRSSGRLPPRRCKKRGRVVEEVEERQRRNTRRPNRLADWMVPLAQDSELGAHQSYERTNDVTIVHISHLGAEQLAEARAAQAERKRSLSKNKKPKIKCPVCRIPVFKPFKVFGVDENVKATCNVCGEENAISKVETTLSCGHSLCNICFNRTVKQAQEARMEH